MALADVVRAVDVSIRAPAKGATSESPSARKSVSSFDPRSREGSDLRGEIAQQCLLVFRSALPRRERLAAQNEGKGEEWFRSALPRRERLGSQMMNLGVHPVFRSALPRRERRSAGKAWAILNGFDPRSREGSDRLIGPNSGSALMFRSALPRRERRQAIVGG